MKMKSTGKTVLTVIQLLVGNAFSAFAVACFALPYGMVVSGTAGVGRVVKHLSGFPVTYTVAIINIILFIVGFAILGKEFAATIVLGTFSFPFFLGIFQKAVMLHHLVEDPLLAAICAGVIDGVGMGMILRVGGSSGGIDVPPIIMNRKFGWKVAPLIYAIDVSIFLIQLPLSDTNAIILGILYALIFTIVMNHIIVMDQGGVQIMIFSKENERISERLLELGYGTTFLHCKSGYFHHEEDVLYCVAGSRNMHRIKREVLSIDDKAFLTISNATEVNGNGFTILLGDEEYHPDPNVRRKQGFRV